MVCNITKAILCVNNSHSISITFLQLVNYYYHIIIFDKKTKQNHNYHIIIIYPVGTAVGRSDTACHLHQHIYNKGDHGYLYDLAFWRRILASFFVCLWSSYTHIYT